MQQVDKSRRWKRQNGTWVSIGRPTTIENVYWETVELRADFQERQEEQVEINTAVDGLEEMKASKVLVQYERQGTSICRSPYLPPTYGICNNPSVGEGEHWGVGWCQNEGE